MPIKENSLYFLRYFILNHSILLLFVYFIVGTTTQSTDELITSLSSSSSGAKFFPQQQQILSTDHPLIITDESVDKIDDDNVDDRQELSSLRQIALQRIAETKSQIGNVTRHHTGDIFYVYGKNEERSFYLF